MGCYVKNKDCQTDYEGTQLSLAGFIISLASTAVTGGQVADVCVFCTNNAGLA